MFILTSFVEIKKRARLGNMSRNTIQNITFNKFWTYYLTIKKVPTTSLRKDRILLQKQQQIGIIYSRQIEYIKDLI